MTTIMTPGSVLSQLTNFFFLVSGLFNDLLIIRLCLTFAYSFLLAGAILGLPSWKTPVAEWFSGAIALDICVWSILNLFVVHGSGVIRMYYDERNIQFSTEEHEMLWRFFYRHSGLSKAQFQALIVPHLELTTYTVGDQIPCDDRLNIVLDGMVLCELSHEEGEAHYLRLASGDLFPLLHVYKTYVPRRALFHRSAIRNPIVESPTCRAFSIPKQQLENMAVLPHARDAWTALLIAALAEIAERQYVNSHDTNTWDGTSICNSNNDNTKQSTTVRPSATTKITNSLTARRLSSDQNFLTLSCTTTEGFHPLFGELDPSEEPDPLLAGSGKGLSRPIGHLFRYLALSVYLPWPLGKWPVGLRHSLRPPTDNKNSEDDGSGISGSTNEGDRNSVAAAGP